MSKNSLFCYHSTGSINESYTRNKLRGLKQAISLLPWLLYPRKTNVFKDILESACLSILVSIYVRNTTFCQSAGGGIESHSMTALVSNVFTYWIWNSWWLSSFNLLLHRYSFWHINNRHLLKTLWEKRILLVTSNFSSSHNVFYSIRYLYPHLSIFLTSYLYLLLN